MQFHRISNETTPLEPTHQQSNAMKTKSLFLELVDTPCFFQKEPEDLD
jgi:hypothetical protein